MNCNYFRVLMSTVVFMISDKTSGNKTFTAEITHGHKLLNFKYQEQRLGETFLSHDPSMCYNRISFS